MYKTETNKNYGFIAGGLVAAYGLWTLISILSNFSKLTGVSKVAVLMIATGAILVAVGFFLSKDKLSVGGLSLIALSHLFNMIYHLIYHLSRGATPAPIAFYLLNTCGFALLAYALWKKTPKMSIYCYVAGCLLLAAPFIYWALVQHSINKDRGAGYYYSFYGFISLKEVVRHLIASLSAVFFGLSLCESKPRKAIIEQADSSNTIEKLTKLKALLDSGIITQEEFDAKKKELLGVYL